MGCWNETRSEGVLSFSPKGEELKDCSVSPDIGSTVKQKVVFTKAMLEKKLLTPNVKLKNTDAINRNLS